MTELYWYKCKGGIWCELQKLDLTHKHLQDMKGVYVMWVEKGANKSVIKVGNGSIATELEKSKRELAIMAFFSHGLKVSWAEVSSLKMKNIHRYLVNKLEPKITENTPDSTPVECNLPWEAIE
jgi:hypothetical protein